GRDRACRRSTRERVRCGVRGGGSRRLVGRRPTRAVAHERSDVMSASTSKPVGPYTPIVRAGDWLVVSGQIGLRDGSLVSGGMQAELRQALSNIRALLDNEGV